MLSLDVVLNPLNPENQNQLMQMAVETNQQRRASEEY
jgi:hypothetical protein